MYRFEYIAIGIMQRSIRQTAQSPIIVRTSVLAVFVLYLSGFFVLIFEIGEFDLPGRVVLSCLVAGGYLVIVYRDRIQGLAALTAGMIPQKILINHEILLNSLPFLEMGILTLAFMTVRPIRKIPGKIVFAFFVLDVSVYFIVSDFSYQAMKSLLGVVIFFSAFYVVAERLQPEEAMKAVSLFAHSMLLLAILSLSFYDLTGLGRLGSALSLNPNNIALFIGEAVICSVFMLRIHAGNRAWLWGSIVIGAVCLLFLGSRTYILFTIIGLVVLNNPVRAILYFLPLCLVILVVINVIDLSDSPLLHQLTKGLEDRSLEEMSTKRWVLMLRGFELFQESPIWGSGLGRSAELLGVYRDETEKYLPIHSVYLLYLVEMGIHAFVLIILWNLSLLWHAFRQDLHLAFAFTVCFIFSGIISGTYFDIEYALIWSLSLVVSLKGKWSSNAQTASSFHGR